jgi:hypothetical protein
MGQAANSGRNASLDEKKSRAAGRRKSAETRDFDAPQPGRGKAMGAFGSGSTRRRKSPSGKHGNAGSGRAANRRTRER